ncbi:Surfactin synthase thioesterase subunit [Streptomyces sp. WMMB 714]|uniref:thioesterase II family protein n=1 Tax=Streptomyces sp. WMMB 714 TaxID=1286822 RepID=UPI000698B361|nr:alpha/beta fold hydrolase [Streptomyces sp. WMMB 714]SCK10290.1 Surfactin synthase thioesterase subunit [Streptomyces sp. WMMB 714]
MSTRADAGSGAVFPARPVPRPQARLFLFHHAGGSHQVFRDWARYLPPEWEVCLTDAPGRGMLADSEPLQDVETLVRRFLDELLLWLDRPFAFFGHSMGALVAHELTLALAEARLPVPVWVGLSARGCPRSVTERPTALHQLPADRLRVELAGMGGTPQHVLDDPELWGLLEPVIRADFGLVERWRPGMRRDLAMPVPFTVLGATRDPWATPAELAGWAEYGEHFRGCRLFEGEHFYFASRGPEIPALVAQEVRAALAGLPARARG